MAFGFIEGAAEGAAVGEEVEAREEVEAGEEVEAKRMEVHASIVDTIDAEIEAFGMPTIAEY